MTPMDDLIARLEGGEGADRELDALIAEAFGEGPGEGWTRITHRPGVHDMYVGYWERGCMLRAPKPVTASLDAAVAFVERMLPGVTDNSAIDFVHASIGEMFERGFRVDHPTTPQMARAVVASMLRALAQKDQDNG